MRLVHTARPHTVCIFDEERIPYMYRIRILLFVEYILQNIFIRKCLVGEEILATIKRNLDKKNFPHSLMYMYKQFMFL